MNVKDCFSAVKPMGDVFECEHTKADKRKIKSMVVQARHAMGNPAVMLKDYVLPLSPESPRPFNLQHKIQRENFALNSNKIQAIIDQSTTEINDSISFNRRVYAQRSMTGTKWLDGNQDRAYRQMGIQNKKTILTGHVCEYQGCCTTPRVSSFITPRAHKTIPVSECEPTEYPVFSNPQPPIETFENIIEMQEDGHPKFMSNHTKPNEVH